MRQFNLYNKWKGIVSVAIAAPFSALLFSSCSDFLEIEPRDIIVLEQFWNEKSDVDGIVSGCYTALQSDACIKRMITWGEARSENVSPGNAINQDGNLLNVLNENITAKNGYTTWVDFYNVINRCNLVIKYAPDVAAIDPGYTQSELQATIAEMTALRSLCYFYLIRAFRDVPFSREAYTDDDQQLMLPATSFDNVLDSLIYDLESVKNNAVERYPTTTPSYQTGRITKDAINAMLCEMYLWKKDYAQCIQYADQVIASKARITEELRNGTLGSFRGRGTILSTSEAATRVNGYPLVNNMSSSNNFGNAYDVMFAGQDENLSTFEAQQEIIFQLIFSDRPEAENMPNNTGVGLFFRDRENNSISGCLAPSDFIIEDIAKESGRNVYEDKNKKMDARLYINCNPKEKTIVKYVNQGVNVYASSNDPTVSYSPKWAYGNFGSNWIIYRLADIMLLKAEALAQQLRDGSDLETINYNKPIIDKAFSLINAVNKRSVCQTNLVDTLVAGDYQTKSQLETLVMKERQRELMFEGKRWFDLVRQARREGSTTSLTQAALRKVSSGSSLIANKLSKMDAIYWPYNYEELKVNTLLVQNPAFNSGVSDSYK